MSRHDTNVHVETSATRSFGTSSVAVIVANGVGMITNGYIASLIGFLLLLLLKIYGQDIMNDNVQAAFTYTFLAGYIVGEIAFGVLIDRIGRKKGLIGVTVLILIGSIGSTVANGTTSRGLVWMLVAARSLIGIAQGGEYACTAVSTTESVSHIKSERRGMVIIGSVYVMVAVGCVLAPVVTVILLAIFKDNLEPTWRLLAGLPIVPTGLLLYYRLYYMQDDRDKTCDVATEFKQKPSSSTWIFVRRYWFLLLVPTINWMLYNFIFYPASVYSAVILDKVAEDAPLITTCAWNIVIIVFYLVGDSIACVLVDRIGRRYTAIMGFFGQAAIGFIVGACYQQLVDNYYAAFVVLYGALLGFGEVAGMIGSLCLTEYTPSAYRGTAYGVASGCAKAAGLLGTVLHSSLEKRFGTAGEFIIFGVVAAAAGMNTLLFLKETMGPGVMEKADEDFERYLEALSDGGGCHQMYGEMQQLDSKYTVRQHTLDIAPLHVDEK